MNIIVGSKNPAKIGAVKNIFPHDQITSMDVSSNVSSQPLSDEETKQGALNRAKQCAQSCSNTIGIGLEGGVMFLENEFFLCNWGALVTSEGKVYTASGARIMLPNKIGEQLKQGAELGDLMDHYAKKKDIRKKEGAIGVFTNNLVSRKDMFSHVVQLLKGQLEYWS